MRQRKEPFGTKGNFFTMLIYYLWIREISSYQIGFSVFYCVIALSNSVLDAMTWDEIQLVLKRRNNEFHKKSVLHICNTLIQGNVQCICYNDKSTKRVGIIEFRNLKSIRNIQGWSLTKTDQLFFSIEAPSILFWIWNLYLKKSK